MENSITFKFEESIYEVAIAATVCAGDVVKLPDGRFVELTCLESMPPLVADVTVVDGPTDVPDPSGFAGGHKGQAWDATLVE